MAAQGGRTDAIAALINTHEFDPNARNNEGITPLHLAAGYGTYEAVTELIKHKANLFALSEDGMSVLHYAAKNNKTAIIASLVKEHGLTPHYRIDRTEQPGTLEFETPLGLAVATYACMAEFALRAVGGELTEREKIFYRHTAGSCLSGLKTDADETALVAALMHESLTPWDPNTIDSTDQSTALIRAAKKNCLTCVCFLLKDTRTNPNVQDKDKKTALHHALEYRYPIFTAEICTKLLNLRRTKIALQDKDGRTPRDILNQKLQYNKVANAFDLRKMRVQAYLSLKNARCSEQCSEKECVLLPQLPADVCFKIVGLLTAKSLPTKD